MKYLTRFAVAMLMASPAMLRAQSVSDSTSTRETVHDWLFAAGHANVLATYLSPLEYTGPAFSVAHRSERLARWGRGKVTAVSYTHLDVYKRQIWLAPSKRRKRRRPFQSAGTKIFFV